ncbi:MAG: M15 family metallopeptidase [Nannocystaceae bacterium]
MIRALAAALVLAPGCGDAAAVDERAADAAAPQSPADPQGQPEPGAPAKPQPVAHTDATPAVARAPELAPPPVGLVDLRAALPQARFAIGYATADNFTGAPLPGYEAPGAWAHPALAAALVEVDRALVREGLGLLIYDAYRRAAHGRDGHLGTTQRPPRPARRRLHRRALAAQPRPRHRPHPGRAPHRHAAADGRGTASRRAARPRDGRRARRNRERLRARLAARLRPHDGEWWHFALPHGSAAVLDVLRASGDPRSRSCRDRALAACRRAVATRAPT